MASQLQITRDGKTLLKAQFNPTEYTHAKGVKLAEIAIPGLDAPILQYIRGDSEKLTVELLFDGTMPDKEGNVVDVEKQTKVLHDLAMMDSGTHAVPKVTVSWGTLSFVAVVESVQRKLTLFDPEGKPLRAMVSLTFREYKTLAEQLGNANLQSADHSKRRVVRRGDTLGRIAAEEYGDAGEWRRLAEHNADVIPNPRRLVPGTTLRVPPILEFGTGTESG